MNRLLFITLFCVLSLFRPIISQAQNTNEANSTPADSTLMFLQETDNTNNMQVISDADSISADTNPILLQETDSVEERDMLLAASASIDSLRNNIKSLEKEISRRPKIVHDTITIYSDSTLLVTIDSLALCISTQNQLLDQQISLSNGYKSSLSKYFICICAMFVLILILLIGMICKYFKLPTKLYSNDNKSEIQQNLFQIVEKLNLLIGMFENGQQQNPVFQPSKKTQTVSLDAYNNGVAEFKKLNDHIADLKRPNTKVLINKLYLYLSMIESNESTLYSDIAKIDLPENTRIQFVAVVNGITNFINGYRKTIDNYLENNPNSDNIRSYKEAVRMPINEKMDGDLDTDILGNTEGTVKMVHKLGYHFPGNTVVAFREKSLVEVG